MTADNPNDFPYTPTKNPQEAAARKKYWATAIGLQMVDGLKPSTYLRTLARKNIEGVLSLQETGECIKNYYAEQPLSSVENNSDQQEADFVSQRIAELLSSRTFFFMPDMLSIIHRSLFQDLNEATYRPGEYKTKALCKQESILNGDSVAYADPKLIEPSLAYLFEEERDFDYGIEFNTARLAHFSSFISRLWQVHPFEEGNTRTVAVFTELYLVDRGFDVTNDPFDKHSRYFRDALVRANYRNAKAKITPDRGYLTAFFENLVHDGKNKLDSLDLNCAALFDNPSLLRNIDPSQALNHSSPRRRKLV